MNKKNWLLLGLIVLVSGAISFSLLTRGQSWLDDFAGYLMQAKSILNGGMDEFVRRNTFTVSQSSYPPGPAAYPWGFPLLLAPVYAVFGMNPLTFQLLNTLFYALFLVVFFGLARTRLTEIESLFVTAALAFNPALLLAHGQILSDVPFLFFSTLGIFLADQFIRQKSSPLTGIATGVAIFAANFTRTNGILLLIPLALGQLIQLWPQRRDKAGLLAALKPALVPYLTFGLLFGLQTLIFPDGQSSYLSHFSMFSLQGLLDNLGYYLWLPSATFNEIPGGVVLYPILLVFLIVNIFDRRSRDLPIHVYSLATLAVFILWPERQGLRFIYPILPFLFLFAFDGMKLAIARLDWEKPGLFANLCDRDHIWRRFVSRIGNPTYMWRSTRLIPKEPKPASISLTSFWLILVVVSLAISLTYARDNLAANRAINGPFDPVSAEMFKFVREKIPADNVVIFFKPRAMRLFTDRDAFMTERCEDLPKGNYLALSEKVGDNGQIPPEKIMTCTPSVKLEKIFNNKRFTIYRIESR